MTQVKPVNEKHWVAMKEARKTFIKDKGEIMRSNKTNEINYEPHPAMVKSWLKEFTPLAEFNASEHARLFGFYTSEKLAYVFYSLYSFFAKHHHQDCHGSTDIDEEVIEMKDNVFSLTYRLKDEEGSDDEADPMEVTVKAYQINDKMSYVAFDTASPELNMFVRFASSIMSKEGPVEMFKDEWDGMDEEESEDDQEE